MRCRVCGFEADPGATVCPNCGAKLPVSGKTVVVPDAEMSWNTIDFPKPKEMADIEMSWPELRSHSVNISEDDIKNALDKSEPVAVMAEDASEGYFSKPGPSETEKTSEEPAEKEHAAGSAPVQPEAFEDPKPADAARTISIKSSPELQGNPKEDAPIQPYWYTQKFTATGVMQTGPAWPVAPGNTKPGYPASATIETMTLSEPVPIMSQIAAAAAAEAAKKQAEETAPSRFTLNDILEEYSGSRQPEDHTRPPEEHFYTFKKKNEEFQKLLDMEYDRFHAIHGDDADPMTGATVHSFVPEETVKATELSDFEKLLMESDTVSEEETPAQKFFNRDPDDEPRDLSKSPLFASNLRPEDTAPALETDAAGPQPASEEPSEQPADVISEELPAEEPAPKQTEPQPTEISAAEEPSVKQEPVQKNKDIHADYPLHAEDINAEAKKASDTKDPDPGLFVIPSGDPSKYDIDKIEHTIRELQAQEIEAENNRSERKKRLAAMAAAREAYFRSLDGLDDDEPLKRREEKNPFGWGSKSSERDEAERARTETALSAIFGRKHDEEPAPAPEKENAPSVEDASPVDIWDDSNNEPTKEVPVGSILKALAAGGTVAAAAIAAEKAAETQSAAPKTAAYGKPSAPSVREDLTKTRIFTGSIIESAEELAKRYEKPETPEKKAETLEDLIRKYDPEFAAKAEEPAEEAEPAEAVQPADDAAEAAVSVEKAPEELSPAAAAMEELIRKYDAERGSAVAVQETEEAQAERTDESTVSDAEPSFVPAAEAQPQEEISVVQPQEEPSEDYPQEEPSDVQPQESYAEAPAQDNAGQEEAAAKPAETSGSGADVAAASAAITAALARVKADAEAEKTVAAEEAAPEVHEEAAVADSDQQRPEKVETAEEFARQYANFDGILGKSEEVEEPTHPFDASSIAEADKDDKDDDDDEERPRHVVLKIIAIILIICALFEGVVMGLRHFAPEANITENATQIEESIGEAIMSFFNTVSNGVGNLFNGGGN